MGTTLVYGAAVRLQNQYSNVGSNLGVGGPSPVVGAVNVVGTFDPRDGSRNAATQWTILPAPVPDNPKQFGDNVCSGDLVCLQNGSNFLALVKGELQVGDTSGYSVATVASINSTPRFFTGWYVLDTAATDNQVLEVQDILYLVAPFGALAGALDTNGFGANNGFVYKVSAGPGLNRDNGSGSWKVVQVPSELK